VRDIRSCALTKFGDRFFATDNLPRGRTYLGLRYALAIYKWRMEYDAPGLIGTIVALAAVTFFSAVGLVLGVLLMG